jgi:hypothetical protein
VNLGVQF